MYRLTCFGEVSILGPDQEVIRLRSQKHIALLAYLAANRRRAHDRDELASLLWETPIHRARHSLSQALYDIRTKLDGPVLRTTASRVRFATDHLAYDGQSLEEAVREERFKDAVDLYEGGFAPGLDAIATGDFERWVEGERRRLDELARIALRKQIEVSHIEGRWSEMYIAAQKLVSLDPMDESAHRAAIQALWLHGDQRGALRHFDSLAEMLTTELDAEPDQSTLALVKRIRSSRASTPASAKHTPDELPLIGRRQEFAAMQQAAAMIETPDARLVYMDGEAGIGKTRLIRECTKSMRLAGVRVLNSRCYSAESDAAYLPVLEGIRDLVADVATSQRSEAIQYNQLGHLFPEYPSLILGDATPSGDPNVNRRRMYEEVADVLRRSFGPPTVWVIEDIHWIDASSASLLHYLLRRLQKRPLLMVLTARSHIDLTEAARKLLDDARSNLCCEEIRLAPLEPEEIEELIRLVSNQISDRVIDAIRRCAGGNPFYALEIARSMTKDNLVGSAPSRLIRLSPHLRDLLAVRVNGLDRDAVRILESVAVLDRHASPARVAAMAGLSLRDAAEAAVPLYKRRLVEDVSDRLAFPHDIVREYIYNNLGSLKRTALHFRSGALLADGLCANPATVARHFALGGEKRKAYEFALRAAQESAAQSAHEEAVRMAELAADCALNEEQTTAALKMLARSRFALAHYRTAVRVATDLLKSSSRLSDADRAELWLLVARATEPSRLDGVGQPLAAAEAAARQIEDRVRRFKTTLDVLYCRLRAAWNEASCGAANVALSGIASMHKEACSAGLLTPEIEARALCGLAAYQAFFESSKHARYLIDRAIAMVPDLTPEMQLRTLKLAGAIDTRLANYQLAEAHTRKALVVAEALSDTNEIAVVLNNLAAAVLDRGDWAKVETTVKRVLSLEATLSDPLPIADSVRINLADSYFYQGRYQEADAVIGDVMKLPEFLLTRDRKAGVLALRGLIQLRLAKPGEARVTWEEVLRSSPLGLRGEPHRYKIEWLRHCVDRDEVGGPRALRHAADEEVALEFSNYLKLRWLSHLLYSTQDSVETAGDVESLENELYAVGLGWFIGYTKRWVQYAKKT